MFFYDKRKRLNSILSLEPAMQQLTDLELAQKTLLFKDRFHQGESLDSLTVEAFAVCREACFRVLHKKPYPVQIAGGLALHDGNIAEMKTGEGKTLAETMPAYLNALSGQGVHIVTVNDYLAQRDKNEMGRIFTFLGLSVDCLYPDMPLSLKQKAYQSDILYGTSQEFGFDYLKDHLVPSVQELAQRVLNYAIVDEVDSVLIDEARTPLIISTETHSYKDYYLLADQVVRRLKKAETPSEQTKIEKIMEGIHRPLGDYVVDEKTKSVHLTQSGIEAVENYFNIDNLGDATNTKIAHHVQQALRAHATMKKDVNYLVQQGEVLIIDDFTGRALEGRRYSDGLHQALEAKEGILIQAENDTKATITLQNYFRLYKKLSGMSGTAKTDEQEFKEIYNLKVQPINTNKPICRVDAPDRVYRTLASKIQGVVQEVLEKNRAGRPVLVGTVSVEQSEQFAEAFRKEGLVFEILNAKNHEKEATIIAQAGKSHAITIATNMAGRGTDILLGGNPEFAVLQYLETQGISSLDVQKALHYNQLEDTPKLTLRHQYEELLALEQQKCEHDRQKVLQAGGLHVIGTQRHEASRIDLQLKGRAGRQGDPGSSQFHLSIQDPLIQTYGTFQIQTLEKLMSDAHYLEHKNIQKHFDRCQKQLEIQHYESRKSMIDYDEVDNIQRTLVYNLRTQWLTNSPSDDEVNQWIDDAVQQLTGNKPRFSKVTSEEFENIHHQLLQWSQTFSTELTPPLNHYSDRTKQVSELKVNLRKLIETKKQLISEAGIESNAFQQQIQLSVLDYLWSKHMVELQNTKESVRLSSFGTQKPLDHYKHQAHQQFLQFMRQLNLTTLDLFLNTRLEQSKS